MQPRRHAPLLRLASLLVACALLATTVAPPAVAISGESGVRAAAAAPSSAKSAARRQGAASRAGHVIVRFRDEVAESERAALAASERASRRALRGGSGVELWTLAQGKSVEATVAALASRRAIEYAEPNYLIAADQLIPSDPRFAEQWALRNAGQAGGESGSDIDAPRAWAKTIGSPRTVVAVVDGGVDFSHPDLANNRWTDPADPANGRDDDGDAFVDDTSGWDWISNSGAVTDPAGHGTAVAGLIAAEGDNGVGTAGVMWRASLMSLRVLDERGAGDVASAVEAIDYASSRGAHVINCSWGTDAESRALFEAVARANVRGALVVASAGNDSRNIDAAPRYPASFGLPNVVAVAATNSLDQLTPWSNWAAGRAHVAAPGVDLLSTEPGGGYRAVSGTSGAAALVAGVAGLVKSLRPGLAPARLREVLMRGARPVAGLAGRVASGGVVSAGGSSAMPAPRTNAGEDGGPGSGEQGGGHASPDVSAAAPGHPPTPERRPVTPPHPIRNVPDLDRLRRLKPYDPETPAPIPSTRPNHRRSQQHSQDNRRAASTPGGGGADFITSKYISPLRSVQVAFNALVAGGGNGSPLTARDFLAAGPYAAPAAAIDQAPSLRVTEASDTRIDLSWTASASGTPLYRLERSLSKAGPYLPVTTTSAVTYSDTAVTRGASGTTYLYRVCVAGGPNSCSSPYSNLALGTAYSFFDPVLVSYSENPAQATTIKARHVTELRDAVNAVRLAAGLSGAAWEVAGSSLSGAIIRARDVQELRDRLSEGLSTLGIPADTFTDATLATGPQGTPVMKVHFEELRRYSTALPAGFSTGMQLDTSGIWAEARLNPVNRTGGAGVDLLSGNANWRLPLVSLPGRAGLDLGLSLSYNSRVWTKSNGQVTTNTSAWIGFDLDRGFPAPGFRLGFPTIEAFTPDGGGNGYLLTTTDGDHVELRQVVEGGSLYEATDSSYVQLTRGPDGTTLTLRPGDGSRMTYSLLSSQHHCTEIKDRNGNYLSISYDSAGQIKTVTDTLGRVVTFNYDQYQNLSSITQQWRNEKTGQSYTRTWASFGWGEKKIETNFTDLTVIGIQHGTTIPVLNQVGLPDGTLYRFEYTRWGQVKKISRHTLTSNEPPASPVFPGDYTERSSTAYGLRDDAGPEGDCPRVTSASVTAEDWNGGAAAVTTYQYGGDDAAGRWGEATMPAVEPAPAGSAGARYRETYGTGWQRGLVRKAEEFAPGASAATKTTTTDWAQNKQSLQYELNPRATQITVEDSDANKRQTVFEYALQSSAQLPISAADPAGTVSLPTRVREETGAALLLRSTRIVYEDAGPYLDAERRIVGLIKQRTLHDAGDATVSKFTYLYDQADEPAAGNEAAVEYLKELNQSQTPTVQHDPAYGLALRAWRGNLNVVRRWDAKAPDDVSKVSSYKTGYSTTGSAVLSIDPEKHRSTIDYTDSFSASIRNGTKFAYPTTVTGPEGHSSKATYNYDFGAVTESQSPMPDQTAVGVYGPKRLMIYDKAGRLFHIGNSFNAAYTHLVYPASLTSVLTFTLLKDGATPTESFSAQFFDGAGRVRATSRNMAEAGLYSGQTTTYDRAGRPAIQSNPTEMAANWLATGEDAATGWVYSAQQYDWRGRPTVKTNQDGSTEEAEYSGCGCAGGAEVTSSGPLVMLPPASGAGVFVPGRRRVRTTHDTLGRPVKSATLKPDGTPYATTVTEYDALDQVVKVKEYKGGPTSDGSCPSGTCQVTLMGYDGHGRLETQRLPEQTADTVYTYDRDDTILIERDPRGATQTYGYNNKRHLVTSITFAAPAPIPVPSPYSFTYDAAGNRKSQTDKGGTVAYEYDQLSRLESETRTFSALTANNTHTLGYTYNLTGQLESLTDPAGVRVDYEYDAAGQLNKVLAATAYGNVAQGTEYAAAMKYRAWGALREADYGNGQRLSAGFDARQRVKRYHVRRHAEPAGTADLALGEYEYEADGLVKNAYDRVDPGFDRHYLFDHVARLISASTSTSPAYYHSFSYDEFGNMVQSSNGSWRHNERTVSQFLNNRILSTTTGPLSYPTNNPPQPKPWSYDVAGNVKQDHNKEYTYDATGDKVRVTENGAGGGRRLLITQEYDADGERLRRFTEQTEVMAGIPITSTGTLYYVRSSVLGQVVTELNAQGQKFQTYVYAGGAVVARQEGGQVWWVHSDPVTNSVRESGRDGAAGGRQEFDPLGNDAPLIDPEPYVPETVPDYEYPSNYGNSGNPYDGASGCMVDGQPLPCSIAMRLITLGTGVGRDGGSVQLRARDIPGRWEDRAAEPYMRAYRVPSSQGNQPLKPPFVNRTTCLEAALAAFGRQISNMNRQGLALRNDELGIALLLSEADKGELSVDQTAYLLATAEHETKGWRTLYEEGGEKYFAQYDGRNGNDQTGDGMKYRGRGYVHLTFKDNYRRAGNALGYGDSLVGNPDLAADPAVAARVAVWGLQTGLLTGAPIHWYINNQKTDFKNARRTVNGLDRADLIKGYAEKYQRALAECQAMQRGVP